MHMFIIFYVYVSRNWITNGGAKALAGALKVNTTLTRLDLRVAKKKYACIEY